MTGSAADPSSVAGMSYHVFTDALKGTAKLKWRSECRVWLYRSGGRALEAHEIDMAIPMSPDQLGSKIKALSHYTSDEPAAAAGNRDQHTAQQYDLLGLADYEAIEAFEELEN